MKNVSEFLLPNTSAKFEIILKAVEIHRCVFCEARTLSTYNKLKLSPNRPWRTIGL
jgi:hypothetical protein